MCEKGTADYFSSPKWPEFSKNPKKTSPRTLNQLHQLALVNVLAQLVTKIDFRKLKQQLRMVEIFCFSYNQCRESNVIYEKGQNVVYRKTMPASLLSPYNHRERVKHLSFSYKCDSFLLKTETQKLLWIIFPKFRVDDLGILSKT